MQTDNERLLAAKDLVRAQQYDEARAILEAMPRNAVARQLLARLDEFTAGGGAEAEKSRPVSEASPASPPARAGTAYATDAASAPEAPRPRRSFPFNTAFFVFIGTLLGSLIGAAGDLGGALETFERLGRSFAPEVCLVGSNTMLGDGLGLSSGLKDAFEAEHYARLTITGGGSLLGVERALRGECAHVLAMSEPMPDKSYNDLIAAGIEVSCAAEVGYDVLVFITDVNNPVRTVIMRDLRDMMQGRITSWGQVNNLFNVPVTLLARPDSGTTDFGLVSIGGIQRDDTSQLPVTGNYRACDSNDDCLNQTLSINGALYWGSVSWAITQPAEYIRVLSVVEDEDDPSVNPLREGDDLATYPLSMMKPIYFYVLQTPGMSETQRGLAEELLDYTRGVKGQQLIEAAHFHTHFNPPRDILVPLPPGFGPVGASDRVICLPS
jgi:ABC-type phosphate transport system substrate-binding protein